MKILLVEDNEMNRDMLVRRLKRHGLEVVEAVDGRQALRLATSEEPDLVLMDLNLPGWMGGRRHAGCAPTKRPGTSPLSP
jgi:two-component system cell cycle response regulator DivK